MFGIVWNTAALRDFFKIWLAIAALILGVVAALLVLVWVIVAAPAWVFYSLMFLLVTTGIAYMVWSD